eukprot:scaffold6363_cov98-Skeletonema_menzelii.AAC.2
MAWGSGAFNSCDKLLERVEKNDPTLKELVILPMKTFGAKDLDRLSHAIETGMNTHLVSISASGHPLPPNSLKAFGNALSIQASKQQKYGITSLAIGSKDMGDEGTIALCQGLALSNGALLQHLDLGWKEIGKDGLYEIGTTFAHSKCLRELDLSRNDFGNDGIVQLSKGAAAAAAEHDDDAAGVAFPALEQLILSECNIDSTGMDVLAKILLGQEKDKRQRSKRIHLAIGSNPIGSAGCHSLVQLLSCVDHGSVISHLQAAQCSIGNGGVEILSQGFHRGLEIMDISDNGITTDGAKKLAASLIQSWPDLVEMKIAKNEIGSDGVSAILGSLITRGDTNDSTESGKNSSLQNLDLSYTNCGAEGAKAALRSGGLHTLRLFGNTIGSDGFDAIAPLLRGGHPNIENLDLGGNNAEEDSVVRLLDSIADKKDASAHSRLAVLEIGGNKFGDKAMEALTRLQSVWPDLDVAHDKPVGESGWKEEDQD